MAERKIVEVEETKTETKKSGLNIDLSELKKIGGAILAFVASNPEIISKLLSKPSSYLKKIVNGEDVSKDTKKTVNKAITDSKSGGLTSILGSLTSLAGGDSATTDIFDKISSTVKGAKVAEAAGIDVGGILGGLLGGNKKTTKKSTKKTTKKEEKSEK